MDFELPKCPKCGAHSTAPVGDGMSMPYVRPACSNAFNLVYAMSDMSQLKDAYVDTLPDELLANTRCRIVFPTVDGDDTPHLLDSPASAPAWFVTFCAAVVESPAPVLMVGACRSGKTRLTDKLHEAITKLGAEVSVSEHQRATEVSLKNVHLVIFRQARFDDAAAIAKALIKGQATPDELLALPRWHALIRFAGEAQVRMVDTFDLYQQSDSLVPPLNSHNLAASQVAQSCAAHTPS